MTTATAQLSARRPRARAGLRPLAASCAGLAVAVGMLSGWGDVPPAVVVLLAAVVAAAELVVLPVRLGPSRWPASLTEGAVAACLLVGEGAWSVVAVGAGVAVAQTVRRCPRRKRELDLAVRLLSTACAAAVCAAAGGGLVGAVAGLVVFWSLTCLLLAVAVCTVSSRPFGRLLQWAVRRSALHTAGSAAVGLVAAWLALRAPVGLLGVAAGASVAWSACAATAWRRGEARLFAHLAQVPARTPDVSAQLLVTAAARLLRGADVELVVVEGGLARHFTGDERGGAASSGDVVALDEPWVLEALRADGVRTTREGDRPTLTAALHRPGRAPAVLRAQRAAGAPDFGRQDVRDVGVLVARADAWLAAPVNGGGAAGDGTAGDGTAGDGAAGEAAVVRAQVALERLDALAAGGATTAQVAAVLHELERAVTALLGSAGLPVAPVPQQRSGAAEWTTTGAVR